MCLLITTHQIVALLLFFTTTPRLETRRDTKKKKKTHKEQGNRVLKLVVNCPHEQTHFLASTLQYLGPLLAFLLFRDVTVMTGGYAQQVSQQKNTQGDHEITQKRTSSFPRLKPYKMTSKRRWRKISPSSLTIITNESFSLFIATIHLVFTVQVCSLCVCYVNGPQIIPYFAPRAMVEHGFG